MNIINLLNQTASRIIRHYGFISQEEAFTRFFRNYLICYTKKDRRVMKQAFDRWCRFCDTLPTGQRRKFPDRDIIESFVEYLVANSRGEGAASTYARFKKAVKTAVRKGLLKTDPCIGIKCPGTSSALLKDILSEEEIQRMISTHPMTEYPEIRNAFIFCLYTGLRFCDVRKLTFGNIDYSNSLLKFEQEKTKGHSCSITYIPLRPDIFRLIGQKKASDCIVFSLPSLPTCQKVLRQWTSAARIDKHITWHCARHTFATNLLKNGADVKVVAELLGHSGLRYVERYTRALDEKKIIAVNSLPEIF